MKLRRLQVAGFGALCRREFAFGPGLNLICGSNEAGKSTLQAALGAALYGIYDGCRPPREADALQLRYQPWAGGAYALTLELELEGARRLVISRNFVERRATRTTVFDAASGRQLGAEYPQGRYGQVGVAETHLGIDSAAFRGAAFVAQSGPALDGTAGPLAEALGRVVASAGRESCASALERLEEALRGIGIGPTAKNSPYARARAQAEALERERRRSAEVRDRQAAALERRREVGAALAEQQQRWAALQTEHDRRQLAALRGQIATLRRLDAERHSLLAIAAPAPLPAGAEELLEAWRLHKSRFTDLASLRLAAELAAAELAAAEDRMGEIHTALAALPPVPAGTLAQAESLRRLAVEVAAATAAGDAARGAAEASGEAPTAASESGQHASAASPPLIAGPAGRQMRRWLFACAIGIAVATLLLALRLPAPAAVGLATLAAVIVALMVQRSAASIESATDGGRTSPEMATLRGRLRAAALGAERRRRDLEALLDRQLASVGLPAGTAGMTALEAALAQASRRAGLQAPLAQVRVELDHVGAPQRAYAAALEALRDADSRFQAALDAQGMAPGNIGQRIAALESRRLAVEAHQAKLRRLADLSEQRRLCAQGHSPAELEADAERLQRTCMLLAPGDAVATSHDDADLAGAVAAFDDSELTTAIADSRRSLEVAVAEHARLDGVVAAALGDLREQAEIEEERINAGAALARLERTHRALDLARQQLLAAQDEVHGEVGPRLADLVGPSFQRLTDGRYERLYVDANGLRVRVQAPGRPEPVPIEQLSKGAGDQALLLLRLAVTALLTPTGESIPIFLDEPLAHCDPRRAELLLAALAQAARERQVFFFTCQPSVEALATKQGVPLAMHRLGDGLEGG